MANSWLPKALTTFFRESTDTNHWFALSKLMEESFGRIIIDTPVTGGKTRAFFQKQVLTGDSHLITYNRNYDGTASLDMNEPIGIGKNWKLATLDLWEQLTTLPGDANNILQFEERIAHGEPHALYTSYRFINGQFVASGKVSKEIPPDRPKEMEEIIRPKP